MATQENGSHNCSNDQERAAKQTRTLIAVIILLLLVIIWLWVKPPVPPLPAWRTPAPPPPQGPGMDGPQKQRTDSGVITAYRYNPHLDINAIQLKTKHAGTISIDFRPHTAKAVMSIGGLGQDVTVDYILHPNDEVVGYQLISIKNNRTGDSKVMEDLPPPPDVPSHITRNFRIDNPLLITDEYGGIVALRKDSLLFHFKPGLVDNIAPLIKDSHTFGLMAVRRDDDLGFVNVRHDKVYIVVSVTIDNKTFLVR
ncbi:hypothetical protein [Mucilaginibacter paludis]|uniref:Uncharacterized protein n=1 Tax=Mucilaginibacter paludis DSM 18603 TaxID=714943 RepID=H1YIY9_9SPHI|nr:hypothetical protein [Mucilaginibacter paludis]EHQ27684.1 hypothetical protein Mucpa_3586 [Mucilaginibacter paludis DSM 18603]